MINGVYDLSSSRSSNESDVNMGYFFIVLFLSQTKKKDANTNDKLSLTVLRHDGRRVRGLYMIIADI